MPNRLSPSQTSLLDFVRGASALAVLFGHVFSKLPGEFSFGKTMAWQSLAVCVFFWLSGFLIAYHCLTKPGYSFREYAIDRFSRIYVIFVPVLLGSVVLLVAFGRTRVPAFSDVVANLLMLHHTPFSRIADWLPTVPSLAEISPLWSIAIEWWLYVMFGIVFFFHRSSGKSRLAMLVLLVPAVLVVGYFSLKEYIAITWFIGAMCAFLFVRLAPAPAAKPIAVLASMATAGFAFRMWYLSGPQMNMYDLQLAVFGSAILFCALLAVARFEVPRRLASISGALAFISYSLYLSHEPVRRVATTYLAVDAPTWVRGFLYCGLAIAVATGIALLLEDRHLDVRRWLKQAVGIRRAEPAARASRAYSHP